MMRSQINHTIKIYKRFKIEPIENFKMNSSNLKIISLIFKIREKSESFQQPKG